jgi:hypothetical protein
LITGVPALPDLDLQLNECLRDVLGPADEVIE